MEKALGYSQMKFNYITDYGTDIKERTTQMEMIWINRDNFKEGIDVEKWLESQVEALETSMKELSRYLEPIKAYMEEKS
ncbi:hypothetical protein [Enterococcus mundtii]|uniref:hypothetical protein n=1 Tax=Enterococcus mundtii TaxID=53346 RepID=UPI0004493425|nr:hypothetical protein [Enterococcus mundtii]EYT96281.1 hypothetical protein AK89_03955 [Enterococcus mundtii CRL35]